MLRCDGKSVCAPLNTQNRHLRQQLLFKYAFDDTLLMWKGASPETDITKEKQERKNETSIQTADVFLAVQL